MNRAGAAAFLVALLAASLGLLVAPAWVALPAVLGAAALMRKGRAPFLASLAVAVPLYAAIMAVALRAGPAYEVGPVAFHLDGALRGVWGALRLGAVVGVNLAALSWRPAAVLIDGLRLPPRWTAGLAAVLLAAHDVARDAARLRDARRMVGDWPEGRAPLAKLRAAAELVAPLLTASLDRAERRREALRLAGIHTGPLFVPVVAVAALAVAGRLALVALPNVSLAFVAIFLGGLVFGARVGALAAALAMLLTDFLLTGLLPLGFVNLPAMMFVGLAGGALRGLDLEGDGGAWTARGLAAVIGVLCTLGFSVAADTATWALVREYRGDVAAWKALVAAGLAFNVLPAVANGALFALTVTPVARAVAALQPTPPTPATPPAATP
ncbi:MAG: hypothetical protein ACPGQL_10500 [Thermoplasmatota archaeon]